MGWNFKCASSRLDHTNGTATSCYVGSPSVYFTTPFSSTVQTSADGVGSYCGSAGTIFNAYNRANMQLAVCSFIIRIRLSPFKIVLRVRLGTINAPVLKIATYVSGTKGAQKRATQLSFHAINIHLLDISNARVFYTGGGPTLILVSNMEVL